MKIKLLYTIYFMNIYNLRNFITANVLSLHKSGYKKFISPHIIKSTQI